ncbi:MAG: hypothetical protein ABIH89_06620 [Elusimicrobiota bacterium]
MESKEFNLLCPCCKTKIVVDKDTGGILRHEERVKEKENFNNLLGKYKKQKEGMDKAFKTAFEDEEKRKKLLYKKFKHAVENIDESEDC